MDITLILIIIGIAIAVVFCLCLAIANFAPERFFDIYKTYQQEHVYGEYNVADLVNKINYQEFQGTLRIHQTQQYAGDAYVRGGDLILSDATLNNNSIASFATLAHELGHALQDRDSNKLKAKSILAKISYIIGPLLFPALIAGIILLAIGGNLFYWGLGLLILGVLIFVLSLILKLFTISIEKDASKKAMVILQDYLGKKQLKQAKKLLNSAKLTYWAGFFQTLLGWTMLTKNREHFK